MPRPLGVALAALAGVTVLVALVSGIFVESVQQAASALGLTPAFVAARRNRLDLSVGIALGSASQIALFVAPVLVLAGYGLGPSPMSLQRWAGAVVMMFLATTTASLVTNGGRSTWFVGALVCGVASQAGRTWLPSDARPAAGSERTSSGCRRCGRSSRTGSILRRARGREWTHRAWQPGPRRGCGGHLEVRHPSASARSRTAVARAPVRLGAVGCRRARRRRDPPP